MDHEDEFEYGPSDEESDSLAELDANAAAQEAVDDLRSMIDAAVSEEANRDPHAEEYREQGFRLAWWDDTSLYAAHEAMYDLIDGGYSVVNSVKALRDVGGLSEDVLVTQLRLDMLTGPLVMFALQFYGLHAPDLRPVLRDILRSIPRLVPTPEEEAAIDEATKETTSEFAEAIEALDTDEADDEEPFTGPRFEN